MEWSYYNEMIESDDRVQLFNSITQSLYELDKEEYRVYKGLKDGVLNSDELEEDLVCDLIQNKILTLDNHLDLLRLKSKVLAERYDPSSMKLVIGSSSKHTQDHSFFYDKIFIKEILDYVNRYQGVAHVSILWILDPKKITINFINKANLIFENKFTDYTSQIVSDYETWTKIKSKDLDKLYIKKIFLQFWPKDYVAFFNNDHTKDSLSVDFDKTDLLFDKVDLKKSIAIHFMKNQYKECIRFYRNIQKRYAKEKYTLSANLIKQEDSRSRCIIPTTQAEKQLLLEMYATYRISTSQTSIFRKTDSECIARQRNGFFIDLDGSIYKCWGDFGNTKYRIGHLHKKTNSQEGRYIRFIADLDPWEDAACKKCKILPLCLGGCTRMRLSRRISCHIAKKNLKQLISAQ